MWLKLQTCEKHNLMLIVDNTFLTPVLSRPLDLGADVVIHSGTKYIAGHNDALVGLIVAKGQELCDRIAYIQNGAGRCFLLLILG